MTPINPKQLSTDGYSRFFVMTSFLRALYPDGQKQFSLLDVGGGSPFMASQLQEAGVDADLTILDVLPKPDDVTGKYVVGDATRMDFPDNHFQTIISTDVLEHIDKDKKSKFVEECLRVASDFVIIAAPFDTKGVDEAERVTNSLNKKLFNEGQKWLEEHFEQTKPQLEEIKKIVEKHGYETTIVGTNNLFEWILSTHINLIDAKLGLNTKKHLKINQQYNEEIVNGNEFTSPSYRHFVIVYKKSPSQKTLSRVQAVFEPNSKTPTAAIDYTSKLLNLVADRLSELQLTKSEQEKTVYNLEQNLAQEASTITSQAEQIRQQQSIIDSCKPYLRLRGSWFGRSIRRILRG